MKVITISKIGKQNSIKGKGHLLKINAGLDSWKQYQVHIKICKAKECYFPEKSLNNK